MKDYTLSEAKKICEEHRTCGDCPLKIVTLRGIGCIFGIMPRNWKNPIEPRDMIDLPCKLPAVSGKQLQVVYRDKYGYVRSKPYDLDEESEADAFLAELKGGNA